MPPALPDHPPFVLRARLLTPLMDGGTRWLPDAALAVDADGRIAHAGSWAEWEVSGAWRAGANARSDLSEAVASARAQAGQAAEAKAAARAPTAWPSVDIRPWLILPGLIDLHVHLPQVPSAGLGAGLDLLGWLERHIFPLERGYDVAAAERLAPAAFRAMAAAGTTTFLGYGAIWADSLDATFRAAQAHGIRAVIGKVMMDRLTYDEALPRERILDVSLRQSAELCERWHGADGGRLRYAVTPRFAVSCTAEMLRESAALAAHYGVTWQTHVSEDRGEIATVRELFPEALDYLDVYDRAGALGPRAVLAHAVHCSDREVARLTESGARVAHCPASNMFLASGVMPLARYLEAGVVVGLGSDVAAAPELSIVTQMRTGFYAANALRVTAPARADRLIGPWDWLRLGTLEGARALELDEVVGSLEAGKEADCIAVDPSVTLPPGGVASDDPNELLSRLIFRERPGMVRGAWVRGRRLESADPTGGGAPAASDSRRAA